MSCWSGAAIQDEDGSEARALEARGRQGPPGAGPAGGPVWAVRDLGLCNDWPSLSR